MSWRVAPILGVADVAAAVRYYTDTLGFELRGPVFGGVGDEGPVYAIVWRGDASLHLQIRRGERPEDARESIESDAYVYVDDADALFEEYRARGVEFLRPLQTEPYGLRDFTIVDPFGHRVVFGAPEWAAVAGRGGP